MMSSRESLIFVFCMARQLSTDLESLEISCRQENSQSAFSAVVSVLCTFLKNIPSWHGLCLSCMVIASAAILLLC